jgi:tetratricopeptide (TPR) repeat protein
MRSRSGRLTMSTSAAMVSGLLTLTSISPAFAQGAATKPAAPPAAGAPAAAAPAKPAAAAAPAAPGAAPAPAKPGAPAAAKHGEPAAPAKPKKPLSEKQKKDEAKKLYKDAETKFDKGDFAGAVELYRQADEYVPGAAPKYKIALSLDKQGVAPEAVAAWQSFLDSKPDAEKFKDKIAEAQGRIEALKKTPAKVKVATVPEAPPNLKVAIDGVAQPGPELSVPPGKHKLTLTADGFAEASQEIEVNFAETREVSVALTPQAPPPVAAVAPPVEPPPAAVEPPPPPPAAPVEPRSPVPAYVTLGLAGVGAVVGTIFGIQALGAKGDFDDAKKPTSEMADDVDRNALIADMSFAVALTFGVTGAVLLLSNDTPADAKAAAAPAKKKTAVVAPFVSPTGGGAAARFTF